MSLEPDRDLAEHELTHLSKFWWRSLLVGILLVIAGTASIADPWFSSVGVAISLGAVLIVSGLARIISAFWTGKVERLCVATDWDVIDVRPISDH